MNFPVQIAAIYFSALLFFSCKPGEKKTSQNHVYEQGFLDSSYACLRFKVELDSIYPNQNYQIVLDRFVEGMHTDSNNEFMPNTLLTFQKLADGQYKTLFTDSIACEQVMYDFKEFTGDNLPELLINNNRDFRSNWTYYLYVIDTLKDEVIRIRNFEQIKNPVYLPKYDLIDNHVASGRFWTSFYKINADTVIDFNSVVYGGPVAEDEIDTYEDDYNKALREILKRIKAMHLDGKK